MLTNSLSLLKGLQHPSGLFSASQLDVSTGYNKAWLRDNLYEALGLEQVDLQSALKTYWALFDVFLKHEYKIDHAIDKKPEYKHQYIHARYHPLNLTEFEEEWGNKQNDAVGLFLFNVGNLMSKGIKVTRNEHDLRILAKLVKYLASIEYWKDEDNGIWEENEEVHASSVGACVAGLQKIQEFVFVPQHLIEKGKKALHKLLPQESATKDVDLALLSLIWPLHITNKKQTEQILKNVEQYLLRKRGVIRYKADQYYARGNGKNTEAEWCFGLPWLAIIYRNLGNFEKYKLYLQKTIAVLNDQGELPELYYANSTEHNENSPLGWGQALLIIALHGERNE
jgi:GH15 family glucan-1,4-alpha-glucosidase